MSCLPHPAGLGCYFDDGRKSAYQGNNENDCPVKNKPPLRRLGCHAFTQEESAAALSARQRHRTCWALNARLAL